MARPKTDPHAVPTQLRILDAAEYAFSTHGYALAKLEDIAAEVGIRRPSLLYHFASKAVLYEAIVARTFVRLAAALQHPMGSDGDFEARLGVLVESFVTFMDENPMTASILVRELVAPAEPGESLLVARGSMLLDEVERWIRETGGDRLRPEINIRRSMMQVASEALLRNASGAAAKGMWGEASPADVWRLTRATLLVQEREPEEEKQS